MNTKEPHMTIYDYYLTGYIGTHCSAIKDVNLKNATTLDRLAMALGTRDASGDKEPSKEQQLMAQIESHYDTPLAQR